MNGLEGKRIVLGVTGSIAAYKMVTLASMLRKAGAEVDTVLTESAAKLISPLSFQAVTGRGAYTDQDLWEAEKHVLHIELGEENDAFLIAPATANTIAKLAHGLADNLLTVAALASRTPLFVAPAMDGGMYANPATQANLEILRERGMTIIGPASGHLASGLAGKGRMVEPEELYGALRLALAKKGPLQGQKVLVTAGGTQEPLDPVRVLSNRSSGKQGFALAQAALDSGAEVTLITGPSCLETPYGARRVDVNTADEMLETVLEAIDRVDVLLMAAAVADFRPEAVAEEKIKTEKRPDVISLEDTPDILKAVAERDAEKLKVKIGFAAETESLLQNATQKVEAKDLDMIVANDITDPEAGFGVDTNRVTLIWRDGRVERLELMSKQEVANHVVNAVVSLLDQAELDSTFDLRDG
jgi:phosphopantothenoylcysteine decarboxylase/phosphopantothenate--cysteine ligase